MTKILPANNKSLAKAAQILKSGGLVSIPTETVYGLAADASNPEALEKLFDIKKRPKNKPFSVLIPNADAMSHWACDIPDFAYRLAHEFWPGPLTLILKKAPHVGDLLTGTKDTIGLRVPNHPFTLGLLNELNFGLATPSANISGEKSPTNAKEVYDTLREKVDLIIDANECEIGVASTIVNLTQSPFKILREGAIKQDDIKKFS